MKSDSSPSVLRKPSLQKCDQRFQFRAKLEAAQNTFEPLEIETLQVNITRLCNQACVHCHVDASPRRREMMSREMIDTVIQILIHHQQVKTLDITGGAPELHPDFFQLVQTARSHAKKVLVRHNLTVTQDPHPITGESLTKLPHFFAENKVEVISSLPYYQEFFTDKQRGTGVFQKSIKSLQQLNALGYGHEGSGLTLNLVYNPIGAFLPPLQSTLEQTYKKELLNRYGIHFNQLYSLTNMPIKRFKAQLLKLNGYEDYMEKLVSAFNANAAERVMCRSMISVSYDGRLYDCDFNQMLELEIMGSEQKPLTLRDWNYEKLMKRIIETGDHCFGCTAGSGSSCGGSTIT